MVFSLIGYGPSSPHIACEDIERLVINGVCSFIIALKRRGYWAAIVVLVDLPFIRQVQRVTTGTRSCSFAL